MTKPIWFDLVVDLLSNYPDIYFWVIGLMTSFLMIARGFAELLALFVDKTITNVDNLVLSYTYKAIEFVATVLGWIGIGNFKR